MLSEGEGKKNDLGGRERLGVNQERQEAVGHVSPGVPSPMFVLETSGEGILGKLGVRVCLKAEVGRPASYLVL